MLTPRAVRISEAEEGGAIWILRLVQLVVALWGFLDDSVVVVLGLRFTVPFLTKLPVLEDL